MTVKQTQPETERLNLTKKAVEALPVPAEKRTTHYDTQVRGLGVIPPWLGPRPTGGPIFPGRKR
jgi:hypothetical protein